MPNARVIPTNHYYGTVNLPSTFGPIIQTKYEIYCTRGDHNTLIKVDSLPSFHKVFWVAQSYISSSFFILPAPIVVLIKEQKEFIHSNLNEAEPYDISDKLIYRTRYKAVDLNLLSMSMTFSFNRNLTEDMDRITSRLNAAWVFFLPFFKFDGVSVSFPLAKSVPLFVGPMA